MLKKRWQHIISKYPFVANKYFLATVIFLIWMTFFDSRNFIQQYQWSQENDLKDQEIEYYKTEDAKTTRQLEELMTDNEKLEKFARENYFMKKDNEDIFVIRDASQSSEE